MRWQTNLILFSFILMMNLYSLKMQTKTRSIGMLDEIKKKKV